MQLKPLALLRIHADMSLQERGVLFGSAKADGELYPYPGTPGIHQCDADPPRRVSTKGHNQSVQANELAPGFSIPPRSIRTP